MEMKETQLVAFYVSKLNRSSQVHLYAKYLEDVVDDEERKISLKYAEDSGLEVLAITKQVMENIRNIPHEMDSCANLQVKYTLIKFIKYGCILKKLIKRNPYKITRLSVS